MYSRTIALLLAALAVAAAVAIGIWTWYVEPNTPGRAVLVISLLPLLWGLVEIAQYRGRVAEKGAGIMTWHRYVIAGMGLLIVIWAGSRTAYAAGLIDREWRVIGYRMGGVVFAALLLIWGNYLPKLVSPWRPGDEPFDWQGVHRFAARGASLAGALLLIIWLAFPANVARLVTPFVVVPFAVLTVRRKLLSLALYSKTRIRPPPNVAGATGGQSS